MENLTPEKMRGWEATLTSQQMNYVMELAIQNGWRTHNPPMWIWAQFFIKAQQQYPHHPLRHF